MSASSIEYRPLDVESAEIRVMILDHSDDPTKVVCTMQTVPLAEAHPFYALSYVWGDANYMQEIILDGQRVRVRNNLCEFLRSLCDALQGPIRVWVDYLCINQDDLDERAAQVAMMGQIYSTADSVYAWLGPPTDDSERVFDFLERSKLQRSSGELYRKIYIGDSTIHQALSDLIERPYWTRLWIIQEIVLAKRLWLFCGSRYMAWHDLLFALAGTKGFGSTGPGKDSSQDPTRLLQNLKESRESSIAMPLSKLVHKFIAAQCQDERDKIYGLLSLAHQEVRQLVKVDYRKPLLQVLLETYSSWASEWILDQDDIGGADPTICAYSPNLFCQELNLLLPEHQLLDLYDNHSLRKNITATVMFKGFWQGGTFEFRHIAWIPGPNERLEPILQSGRSKQKTPSFPIVSQMITPGEYDTFAYTTIAPLPIDRIINVGSIMLIVREKGGHAYIAGRGIQQRCSATESLFDPRLWRAQLLPDSVFNLKFGEGDTEAAPARRLSARNRDDFVNIELNAAALVEVLIASKEQDREWKPHEFGLEHRIVDTCRECRLISQFGRRGSAIRPCRCIWTGGDESFSWSTQGLQRRQTVLV